MTRNEQLALAAGLLLGEGCLSIYKQKRPNAKWRSVQPRIDILMADKGSIFFLLENFGGFVYHHKRTKNGWVPMWNWVLLGKPSILSFLKEIDVYCQISTEKYPQILVLREFCQLPDRRVDRSEVAYQRELELATKIKSLKPRNQKRTNKKKENYH